MDNSPEASQSSPRSPGLHASALWRLGDAIDLLGGDTDWIIRALTETVLALRPVSDGNLTSVQVEYLIASGATTSEGLETATGRLRKGILQLGAADVFLTHIQETLSIEEATGLLGWTEERLRNAIEDGALYGVEISGHMRLPAWQFSLIHADKLLPGLPVVIEALHKRLDWQSAAALMHTSQEDLAILGRQSPAEWLRRGGDVAAVLDIIRGLDW